MPGVTGPDFIALQVRDLDAATVFYRDVVGLPVAPASPPDAVVFATTPIAFAVRRPTVDLDVSEHRGLGVALWLRADDAVAVRDRLADRGAAIEADLAESPFGKTFSFRDPEGYLITVHDGG